MWRNANRVTSLLRQRRVIDDKETGLIAYQPVCLLQQGSLKGSTVPNASGDEMVKLVVRDRVIASGARFGCVLADSGYGSSGPFRQALSERGLQIGRAHV